MPPEDEQDKTEDLGRPKETPEADKTENLGSAAEASGSDKTEDLSGHARAPDADVDATLASEPLDADHTLASEPLDSDATLASGASLVSQAPSEHTPSEVPQAIGSYAIVRELGRGGMGVVYIAEDPVLERQIALKVLPERLAQDPAAFSRFQSEAKLLAAMNHPNIATIHSLEESDGLHFLTMELIEGKDIGKVVGDHLPSVDEWLSICRQVAAALEAAHRNGVVHLDLKPGNIMMTADGLVKVLDFGLAMALGRLTDESGEARTLSRSQDVVSGTPGYMSPEQLQGRAVDSRADIWAFGCILYECICGQRAFPGKSMTERIQVTLTREPDLDALTKDTPKRVRDLLERCLVRDEEQRLSSITKARQALEEEIALRALPEVTVRREATPNNLPAQLSTFVGREAQKTDIRRLLGENRLLTLTGVGGGGKTRLALEAGRELLEKSTDGVWFVDLAPLADPSLVPQAVTTVLGLRDDANRTPTQVLTDHLRSRISLLILDNCEHVLQSAAELTATILQTCPDVRILTTSREALGVAGEVVYQVPSLRVPRFPKKPSLDELLGVEAVELFSNRAGEVKPGFAVSEGNAEAVAQICQRLDGIPLAIELAAARIKVLPPEEIAKRLDKRFRLLGSSKKTGLPHHQTLKALIDWSYDHLTEPEQALLRRLSLFAGGWTLDAAEAVCACDVIDEWEILDHTSSLVDKCLVEVDAEGGRETGKARYRMLETIREYSRERVREKDEGSDVLERHRDYFLGLAEECEPGLTGPGQLQCLARLSAEHDNLRLALDVSTVPGVDPEIGWRLSSSLGRYFFIGGHWNEGRRVYAEQLSRPDAPRKTAAAAGALNWAGNLAKLQGDLAEAWKHLEESLAIRRDLGEEAGIAASLNNLGNVAKDSGDYEKAMSLYEESLALQRKLGNQVGIALALNGLGVTAYMQGDYPRALTLHEESLKLRKELGDRRGVAHLLNNLGAIAEAMGDFDGATAWWEESLVVQGELNDRMAISHSLNNLGILAGRRGDFERAKNLHLEGLEIRRDLGDRMGVAVSLNNLGMVCAMQGDCDGARDLFQECLSMIRELEDWSILPSLLRSFGILVAKRGDAARATRLFAAAEASAEEAGTSPVAAEQEMVDAELQGLRDALGEREFKAHWGEGRSLEREAALALAEETCN